MSAQIVRMAKKRDKKVEMKNKSKIPVLSKKSSEKFAKPVAIDKARGINKLILMYLRK